MASTSCVEKIVILTNFNSQMFSGAIHVEYPAPGCRDGASLRTQSSNRQAGSLGPRADCDTESNKNGEEEQKRGTVVSASAPGKTRNKKKQMSGLGRGYTGKQNLGTFSVADRKKKQLILKVLLISRGGSGWICPAPDFAPP